MLQGALGRLIYSRRGGTDISRGSYLFAYDGDGIGGSRGGVGVGVGSANSPNTGGGGGSNRVLTA